MLATLKKRGDFLRVRGGGRWATAAFVLEGKPRIGDGSNRARGAPASDKNPAQVTSQRLIGGPRFGFTVTKKLGNAVKRNRIRRRLKAVVEQLAKSQARQDCDYVVVARAAALNRPFGVLAADLEQAFRRVHRALDRKRRKD